MAISARFSIVAVIDGADGLRNLLVGSALDDVSRLGGQILTMNDGNTSEAVSDVQCRGINSLHVKNDAGQYPGIYFRPIAIMRSTAYHVSVMAKGTGTFNIEVRHLSTPSSDGSGRVTDALRPNKTFTLTSDWQQYDISFTTDSKYDYIEVNFWVSDKGTECWLSRFMLEKGVLGNGWTRAETDMKGVQGDAGKDSLTLACTPSAVVWNQADDLSWSEKTIIAAVFRGGVRDSGWTFTFGLTHVTQKNKHGGTLWLSGPTSTTSSDGKTTTYPVQGNVHVKAEKDSVTLETDVQVLINAQGTWRQSVKADTMKAVSEQTVSWYDKDGKKQQGTYATAVEQSSKSLSGSVKENGDTLAAVGITKNGITLDASKTSVRSADGKTTIAVFGFDADGNPVLNASLIEAQSLILHGNIQNIVKYISPSADNAADVYTVGKPTVINPETAGFWRFSTEDNSEPRYSGYDKAVNEKIAVLPMYDAFSGSVIKTPACHRAGIRISIQNEYNHNAENWDIMNELMYSQYTGGQTAICTNALAGIHRSAMILCADPRVLDMSNYNATGDTAFNISITCTADNKGLFICNGRRGKLLIVMPGETVELQSYVKDNILYWQVLNGAEFRTIGKRVYVSYDGIENMEGMFRSYMNTGSGNFWGEAGKCYLFGNPAIDAKAGDEMNGVTTTKMVSSQYHPTVYIDVDSKAVAMHIEKSNGQNEV